MGRPEMRVGRPHKTRVCYESKITNNITCMLLSLLLIGEQGAVYYGGLQPPSQTFSIAGSSSDHLQYAKSGKILPCAMMSHIRHMRGSTWSLYSQTLRWSASSLLNCCAGEKGRWNAISRTVLTYGCFISSKRGCGWQSCGYYVSIALCIIGTAFHVHSHFRELQVLWATNVCPS